MRCIKDFGLWTAFGSPKVESTLDFGMADGQSKVVSMDETSNFGLVGPQTKGRRVDLMTAQNQVYFCVSIQITKLV